jgi:hypothetical protein
MIDPFDRSINGSQLLTWEPAAQIGPSGGYQMLEFRVIVDEQIEIVEIAVLIMTA